MMHTTGPSAETLAAQQRHEKRIKFADSYAENALNPAFHAQKGTNRTLTSFIAKVDTSLKGFISWKEQMRERVTEWAIRVELEGMEQQRQTEEDFAQFAQNVKDVFQEAMDKSGFSKFLNDHKDFLSNDVFAVNTHNKDIAWGDTPAPRERYYDSNRIHAVEAHLDGGKVFTLTPDEYQTR